jgi:glutathione synthase
MRALFVMDPLSTVLVDRDSSYALMLAWQERGGEVWHCLPTDLSVRGDRVVARASRLRVGPRPKVADVLEEAELPLSSCRVVFQRKDPPYDMAYVYTTWVLDLAAISTRVVNDPRGIRDTNEKIAAMRFPDLQPDTALLRDGGAIRRFLDEHGGRCVIKPWDGNGGRGVFVLDRGDRNLASIIELSTRDGREPAVVQAFLPEVRQGDKRILLVDGEPRGAFLRVPADDDHRGNMHVGATVHGTEITARDREICARIGPWLRERGLLFVGIDVIGNCLTEINVTSPTGIQEVRRLTGVDVAAEIVERVV